MPVTKSRSILIGLAAAALALSTAMPASAESSGPRTMSNISCDGVSTKAGITLPHKTKGKLTFTQIKTNPKVTSYVTMVSALSQKTVGYVAAVDSGTITWNNVLPANYYPRVKSYGSPNCNGFWAGNGQYDLTYSFTTRD